MAKDLYIPVTLRGNRLEAKASLGQTVIVTEGPETYTGPVTVTPSESEQVLQTADKFLTDNVTMNPIPSEYVNAKADYDNALTAFGVESDLADGITALTEYSNEITGETDETLSEAVRTLADGYGSHETDYDVAVLPSEYQRVEYIQSSGTQYIEIPFNFSPTDEIHTVTALDFSNGVNSLMVCPKTFNDNNNRFGIGGHITVSGVTKALCVAYGNLSMGSTFFAYPKTNDGTLKKTTYKDFIFACENRTLNVDTIQFGSDTSALKLFYGHNANKVGKIRYYVHKKADGRSMALYACYRKSDGEIGLYDIDNDVFYTNDGTGTFTKGSDI